MSEQTRLIFDFNWKLTLCVILIFPLLVKLSVWQLGRAEEKEQLQKKWQEKQAELPAEFTGEESYPDYQRVHLSGVFEAENFWLKENQINNGQIGYNVMMPFRLANESVVVVDRGWILGSPLRDFVPDVPIPKDPLRITGVLTRPSDSKLIREAEVSAKSWPHKILEVDVKVMRHQSGLALQDQVLRIDPDSPGALTVIWRPMNMSAAKHYGYSVQWALLALALIILYVFASTNLAQLLKREKS